MRAVIQRVNDASITIDHDINRKIGRGLVVFLGVMKGDSQAQSSFLAKKILELRIFNDEDDKMNLSLQDIAGDILIVPNFTLSTDCKKGRRPSFDASAPPGEAKELYQHFVELVKEQCRGKVATGEFGSYMDVDVHNSGPVTIIIDTEKIGK